MSERSDEPGTGRFLGVPYDWRSPTVARYKLRLWNPHEPRLIVPRAWGWGYDINFARLFRVKPQPKSGASNR
jgi:hypothetical protein